MILVNLPTHFLVEITVHTPTHYPNSMEGVGWYQFLVLHPPLSKCNTPFDCIYDVISHALHHGGLHGSISAFIHVIVVKLALVSMPPLVNLKKLRGWGLGTSDEPQTTRTEDALFENFAQVEASLLLHVINRPPACRKYGWNNNLVWSGLKMSTHGGMVGGWHCPVSIMLQ